MASPVSGQLQLQKKGGGIKYKKTNGAARFGIPERNDSYRSSGAGNTVLGEVVEQTGHGESVVRFKPIEDVVLELSKSKRKRKGRQTATMEPLEQTLD